MRPETVDLILFHKGCPDGWCSAYIAHRAYPQAALVPFDQGIEPPYDDIAGKHVLSVDIRWKNREAVLKAQSIAASFTVFDHHASGEGDMDGLPNFVFDKNRSGAGITWDYLFGKDASEYAVFGWELNYPPHEGGPENPYVAAKLRAEYEKQQEQLVGGIRSTGVMRVINRPWWVNYVEDRDLWKWELPKSKEIAAYINSYDLTLEAWDSMVFDHVTDMDEAAAIGGFLRRQEMSYVEMAAKYAEEGWLYGNKVLIANANYFIASELGHKLYTLRDDIHVSVTWYERMNDREIYFSLRGDGTVNVGQICKLFPGGGGHHNAGGFHLETAEGRDLINSILWRPDESDSGSNQLDS